MQIIEKNSFNLRSAFFELKNKESKISFLALPVVHIGTVNYYNNINKILEKSDLIIYEGIPSKKIRIITATYKIVKIVKRLDLITQSNGINYKKIQNKLIWNDINKNDFDNSWNNLSIFFRLLLFIIVPIYLIYILIFGTKNLIANNLQLDDLPSSKDIEYESINGDFNKMDKIILKKRDKIIIKNLKKYYNENKNKEIKVVLLYGAKHMVIILKFLFSINFRIVSSSWIKIFNL